MKKLITAESVTEGHVDKVCDQISDAILDDLLKQDPMSRVAVETMATNGLIIVAGEVTTKGECEINKTVKRVLTRIGYNPDDFGILNSIHSQSKDIAQGVDTGGAGDQGMMIGYATDETKEYMPLPIYLAHKLTKKLADVRKSQEVGYLKPDGKSQVTVEYNGHIPEKVTTIVISSQHESIDYDYYEYLKQDIIEKVINKTVPPCLRFNDLKIHINPTGKFEIGGPVADTGLTGRKIIVDTYGGLVGHGGGAFCLDSETEYLTLNGWKKINSYNKNDLIAQWNNGILEFVKPIDYIECKADKMYHFYTPYNIDMVLSENHDIVYKTSKNNLNKKKVKDVIKQHQNAKLGFGGEIPVYFKYNSLCKGINLSDDQIQLQVAFCADGTINKEKNKFRISLKKKNKIERLKQLLLNSNTFFTEKTNSDNFTRFYFIPPIISKSLVECFRNKINKEQMAIIAKEVTQWDGILNKCFRTTQKEDADFVQFIFMSIYHTNTSILIDDRVGLKKNKYTIKSICYIVNLKKNKYVGIKNGYSRKEKVNIKPCVTKDSKMYCFTVPSGILIVRRNNRVFVTGNSGKDPTKVDRSGAYMARHIAKSIVASKYGRRCLVQIAYAIGVIEPVSIFVKTDLGGLNDENLIDIIKKNFDLRPQAIIEYLDLRKPIYEETASYGHFGRDKFPWEKIKEL